MATGRRRVDGCEGRDRGERGEDLGTPFGGLGGERGVAEADAGDESCLEEEISFSLAQIVSKRWEQHLQRIPSSQFCMFMSCPVIPNSSDGIPGLIQAALVRLLALGRFIGAAISSIEGFSDDEGPIHDDSEVTIAPHHYCVSKAVFWCDESMPREV